jgi:hypothetical protein
MNNYKFGKIYRLISPSTDEIYIGSTTKPLYKRLQYHKSDYKKYLNGTCQYVSSFELLKYDDYKIELICDYPCNSRKELDREEGLYQRKMKCVNKNIAGRTDKEWWNENKDEVLKQRKKYYDDNKDEILKKQKIYREKNKDEVLKQRKEYREKNKDEILKKKGMKITCECGAITTNGGKARHYKSKKHIKFVESSSFS